MRLCVALLALGALTGCATNFEPKPLAADHPANAQGEEAPRSRTSHLIVTDELSRNAEMQLARKDVPNPNFQDSAMSHDMSKMPAPDASATAPPASKEAVEGEMKKTSDEMKTLSDEMKAKSDSAKSDPKKPAASQSTPAAAVYTCPMHPEINLPAPGKCPKCGMTLVKKESGAK